MYTNKIQNNRMPVPSKEITLLGLSIKDLQQTEIKKN